MNDADSPILIVFGVVVIFGLGALLGGFSAAEAVQRAAVKAGAAEWVADDDGDAEFKWKISEESDR
jgi:hypothetical protein